MAPAEVLEQVEQLDDVAFQAEIFRLIQRELGMRGLMRFLRVYGPHEGNFTEERQQWLDGTLDQSRAATATQEASH